MSHRRTALYDKKYFTTNCSGYREWLRYKGAVTEARLLRCLEMARVARNDIVLDAGCSRGEIALHVALCDEECVALDYSDDAILMTNDTLTKLPSPEKVHVVLGDVDVLSFADCVFDRSF